MLLSVSRGPTASVEALPRGWQALRSGSCVSVRAGLRLGPWGRSSYPPGYLTLTRVHARTHKVHVHTHTHTTTHSTHAIHAHKVHREYTHTHTLLPSRLAAFQQLLTFNNPPELSGPPKKNQLLHSNPDASTACLGSTAVVSRPVVSMHCFQSE